MASKFEAGIEPSRFGEIGLSFDFDTSSGFSIGSNRLPEVWAIVGSMGGVVDLSVSSTCGMASFTMADLRVAGENIDLKPKLGTDLLNEGSLANSFACSIDLREKPSKRLLLALLEG